MDGKSSLSPISDGFPRHPKHRHSLPPRLIHHSQNKNASLSHIANSADQFLLAHIANSKEYFTNDKTSSEWVEWVKSNMNDEWTEFLARSKTHAEDCAMIVAEMEEMQRKIDNENRLQTIRLSMAVKERVQAKEIGHLRILRDGLEKKMDVNEKSWKDAISAVRNAEVLNGDTEAAIQAELDVLESSGQGLDMGGPLSPL